ncbi:MAG: CoA transferase [Chloroflexi bacterium]|nr:CoA transferase [Chloroflexota bacterium]
MQSGYHGYIASLALSGVRVLELAQGVAGPYAGRLLADLGADVVKVEPPTGDVTRTFGPFADCTPHPERSGMFAYLNTSKRGVVLDLDSAADRGACQRLAGNADVVIESFTPAERRRLGLDSAAFRKRCPSLVVVSVTPFGCWGPRVTWRGNDLIAFHSSGFAFGFPAMQVDDAALPPLNAPTYAAEFLAGQVAAAAAMHGLLAAQRTGHGSHLDVSLQEAVASANNAQFNRVGSAADGGARRVFSDRPSNSVVALLPCSDGWVAISPREEHQWSRWLEVMGSPAWAEDPRFGDRTLRDRHWAELYPLLADWSRVRSRSEVFEAAQARRVACLPLGTATDLLASAQLAARGFFAEVEDAELGGRVPLPGRPYHWRPGSGSDARPGASRIARAPRLGEHTAQVLVTAQTSKTLHVSARTPGDAHARLRPLEGVRVMDFSWVLTGPICTRYLAALGAEVIKVESASRADLSQRNLSWEELNSGKHSITLNLKHARARELARALIARSDVVVENFSSGVMERLGLDYVSLQRIKPDIIMASSSAHGRTGPDQDQVAYGTLIQCSTGWAALSAHPGYPPRSAGGVWTDPLTAVFETVLVLAAIWRRRRTGLGGMIDLSMAETTIAALPEPVLAWSLGHQVLGPRGNRHPVYAPQGCYPAQGEDRWIALSVQTEADWAALCELIDRPDLLADPRLSTPAGRREHHDLLDAAIAAWTAGRSAPRTAAVLQERGIAATATLEPADVVDDVQLQTRAFTHQVPRLAESGTFTSHGVPWVIDRQRSRSTARPPTLGQHNAYVFKSLLGMQDHEYAALIQEQIIY